MRLTNYTTIALLALVGCGVDASGDSSASLRIEPADATRVVTDGQPVTTQYRAYLVNADGSEEDVTAQTAFVLDRPELGTWHEGDLELRGAAVGPSNISATYETLTGAAAITVYAHTRIVDDDAALANVPALFDSVRPDTSCSPLVTYPETGTILPSNLDGLDVQWADYRNEMFEVSFETAFATVELYTRKLGLYTTNMELSLPADAWAQLASTRDPVSMRVSGISGDSPSIACTSQPRSLLVSEKPLEGAIYSWTDGGGIWRHDVATRGEPEPLSMTPTNETVTSISTHLSGNCAGCALSQDGSRLALRDDNGEGMIVDFAQDRVMSPKAWRSATFTALANKLVIEQEGALSLIDETGTQLASIPTTAGASALDPQLSPAGNQLVNVESTGFSASGKGKLVVRSFQDDGNVFGDTKVLVDAWYGTANYYPSWSPDGEWIAYTHTIGWGTSDPQTSIWVVKADGTQSPIRIVAPTSDVDMAARWIPGENVIGGASFYFLSFDSLGGYGTHDVGRQIWMTAFFPKTRIAYPAFHVPFQSLEMSNHVAQWATVLVR
jgi:hypothetical protein